METGRTGWSLVTWGISWSVDCAVVIGRSSRGYGSSRLVQRQFSRAKDKIHRQDPVRVEALRVLTEVTEVL